MSSDWRKWGAPLALGLALACGAAETATAQFFFQPFARSWRYDLPPDEDEVPRYASRGAVARILAREGYELVGPLGRRGDQIVATGVSRRGSQTRFFIDPFEGAVINATRLGPPPLADDRPDAGDRAPPQPRQRDTARQRAPRESARPAEPARRVAPVQTVSPRPDAAPASAPAAPPVAAPAEAAKPLEWAKPKEYSKPADTPAPKAEASPPASVAPVETKAEAPKVVAKPETAPPPKGEAKPASKPAAALPNVALPAQKALSSRPVAARSTGVSHRAIVPPKAAEGATAVTPSAPAAATASSASGAKTPSVEPKAP